MGIGSTLAAISIIIEITVCAYDDRNKRSAPCGILVSREFGFGVTASRYDGVRRNSLTCDKCRSFDANETTAACPDLERYRIRGIRDVTGHDRPRRRRPARLDVDDMDQIRRSEGLLVPVRITVPPGNDQREGEGKEAEAADGLGDADLTVMPLLDRRGPVGGRCIVRPTKLGEGRLERRHRIDAGAMHGRERRDHLQAQGKPGQQRHHVTPADPPICRE